MCIRDRTKDENCQYLNVWTQSLDPQAKRPVMVWLHGGGFRDGSSIEHVAYDGENLSRFGDVVVVTVNHRLNILGYLDLSPYGEKYWNSGNAGNADLVASLQWVHENIAQFGGDPENVTIFGQSGGGGKVSSLMPVSYTHLDVYKRQDIDHQADQRADNRVEDGVPIAHPDISVAEQLFIAVYGKLAGPEPHISVGNL